jgi:hypothetical protein
MEASSSAMASGQASQDLSGIYIHFPNPALDPAVESKSLMIQGPGKRPHLGARMIAIFTIGGTCSVTGRDLARSLSRQADSSAFVRTKRMHVDRAPGIAVSDARCRNYPRTVASEELGLTVSTVNCGFLCLRRSVGRRKRRQDLLPVKTTNTRAWTKNRVAQEYWLSCF